MSLARCFIGLGSNLATPKTQLVAALNAIEKLVDTHIVRCSSFYSSQPMGPQDQPKYVNAVAEISTRLKPLALLDELQKIELQQGRQRKEERWGPRTLDLDILLIDSLVLDTPRLTVPHYGLKQREFVLYPLYEIAPDLVLPCGNSLLSVLDRVSKNGLSAIASDINWERNTQPN
ncbi:2-amino-4-hydroxy-6-hydroxymethyldihydropteridine diphosphokinase [Aliiglaciecola litoralis]|uniref:2-amino-4-hydroxy-6-hydroxymethyldihydropteridine pyrophosphokinase n=1 Tax=Aliiglaciecola litoralis TaxID=582857 RepID=A0ABP3WQG7_9ALTE